METHQESCGYGAIRVHWVPTHPITTILYHFLDKTHPYWNFHRMFDASPCGFNRFQPKGSLGWQWSSKWWWSLQVLRPGPRNTGMLGRAPWGQCAGKYLVSIPPKCWPANNRNDEYQPWNFGGTDTLYSDKPIDEWINEFCFLIATVQSELRIFGCVKANSVFWGGMGIQL